MVQKFFLKAIPILTFCSVSLLFLEFYLSHLLLGFNQKKVVMAQYNHHDRNFYNVTGSDRIATMNNTTS